MQLPQFSDYQQKIESMGKRLSRLTISQRSHHVYTDHKIKSEEIKYNLSNILSRIICNLELLKRDRVAFNNIITQFNDEYDKSLRFEDFLDANIIRFVNDEVRIPGIVRKAFSKIHIDEKDGVNHGDDKEDMLKCVQRFYSSFYQNAKLRISGSALNTVLGNNPQVSVDFLVENGILTDENCSGGYYWSDHNYSLQLRNEIAANLWYIICDEDPIEDSFKRFIRYLVCTSIWPDKLHNYLGPEATTVICNLSMSLLNNESDLNNFGSEFVKAWFDSPSYHHVSIRDDVPNCKIESKTTKDLIEEVEFHTASFHDFFDHQEIRRDYLLLLRFIIQYDPRHPSPYQNLLALLKGADKPFIVLNLFSELSDNFPEPIPYLLSDPQLTPVAFKMLDKIRIDQEVLQEQVVKETQIAEECEVINGFVKEAFEITLSRALLFSMDTSIAGEMLATTLMYLAESAFVFNLGRQEKQQAYWRRYKELIRQLPNVGNGGKGHYSSVHVYPDQLFSVIESVFKHIKNTGPKPVRTEFIQIDYPLVDIIIELLKVMNNVEVMHDSTGHAAIEFTMVNFLKGLIEDYFITDEVRVTTYSQAGFEVKKVKRGVNDVGYEIIEWSHFYLYLKKYNLMDRFVDVVIESTIKFDHDDEKGKYTDINREQYRKIQMYLRSLMMAYLRLHDKKADYEFESIEVEKTSVILESLIQDISLKHRNDDVSNDKIDAFDQTLDQATLQINHQSLASLLYRCVNFFPIETAKEVVANFFEDSNDLGRMLAAINSLDSKELKDIVAEKISLVDIDAYIGSRHFITEIENALIETVNSDSHWQNFASKLVERIKSHYLSRRYNDEKHETLLFEVNLVLAYKSGDLDAIKDIKVKGVPHYYPENSNRQQNRKHFFIGLFQLYNNKDFDTAINIFQRLHQEDSISVTYAFHLWRARTLKALSTEDSSLLRRCYQEWERWSSNLKSDGSDYHDLFEVTNFNRIHYLSHANDYVKFDSVLNLLPNKYLYGEEILSTVYMSYLRRGLHELAFDYLSHASQFYSENSLEIPPVLEELKAQFPDEDTVNKLRLIMGNLRSQRPDDVPRILPNSINGKRNLSEFILAEIVLATNIMLEKIEGVRQITHENRFNDLLLAILRLRFPVWGWEIVDQSRVGTSPGGKDAGESDLLVQASGYNIALWEALILKDKAWTQKHILKCEKYVKSLQRYYILVYHLGKSDEFESKWQTYIADVLSINYPSSLSIDTSKGFEELSHKFDNVRHLKIAKTTHADGVAIFHHFINLGQEA